MDRHPGIARTSSAKDKAEFIKYASVMYIDGLMDSTKFNDVSDDDVSKACITSGVDMAEETWDELKRRGHV